MKITINIPEQDVPKIQRMNKLTDGQGLKIPCEYMELRNQVADSIMPDIMNAVEDQT